MARTYLKTTSTPTVRDYYGSYWHQADLTIEVDKDGNGEWSLTMSNSGGTYGPSLSLYLSINGSIKYNAFYNSSSWPCKAGTKSGTFKVSGDSFAMDLRVCCMQSAVKDAGGDDNTHRWTNGAATCYSGTFYRKYYDNIQGGTVSITDNFDNTFTIKATSGQSGQGNPTSNVVSSPVIKYGYSSTTRTSSCTNGTSKTLTTSGTAATRKVYAQATYTGSLSGSDTKYAEKSIRQYLAPVWTDDTDGSSLTITVHQQPTKTRLTLKDNWLLNWEDCTSCGYSQLEGYRIRIYVNDQSYRWFNLSNTNEVTKEDPDWDTNNAYRRNRYYYDRKDTESAVAVNPNNLIGPNGEKVQPGDVITFGIYPFSYDGKDNVLWGAERLSAEYVVQNAGIVHIKTSSGWKEGQVWVKTSSGWKEAETVNIKTSAGWKESQ